MELPTARSRIYKWPCEHCIEMVTCITYVKHTSHMSHVRHIRHMRHVRHMRHMRHMRPTCLIQPHLPAKRVRRHRSTCGVCRPRRIRDSWRRNWSVAVALRIRSGLRHCRHILLAGFIASGEEVDSKGYTHNGDQYGDNNQGRLLPARVFCGT
jgi:hypothetical protein